MTVNDELVRWGEPPASDAELALANLLAELLEQEELSARGGRTRVVAPLAEQSQQLLEASGWIEQMITTVLTHSSLFENPPLPADAGGPATTGDSHLRLRVLRQTGPIQFQPVASTHPAPMVLRDLRRIPEDVDRVTLRTGDRVRLEVHSDRDGYLTVFNVGPSGTLNLLYPEDPGRTVPCKARTPLLIDGVQMTPPAGRERVYAVWSRVPLAQAQLTGLLRPGGVATRDMRRVQETLTPLPAEDWQAVLLELEHRG
jgi:hypothetical protein